MEYKEWLTQLFENTYPKMSFAQDGELSWIDNDYLNCIWDNKTYLLTNEDYYHKDHKEEDFMNLIIKQLLETLPLTKNEIDESFYYYKDYYTLETHCVAERTPNIIIDQVINEKSLQIFDKKIKHLKKEIILQKLDSILLIKMKKDYITPLVLFNDEKSFNMLFNDHIDYSKDLKILYDKNENQLFLGHKNPISRLECTSDNKAKTLDQWYQAKKENNDV